MSWVLPRGLLIMVILVLSVGGAEPVASQQPMPIVTYTAPTTGAITDPFRPPGHVGGAGNRGIEYSSLFGVARAAANGTVSFSGRVAGREVISIVHRDGVKTTYTGLSERFLQTGASVVQGQGIGWSASLLHFGAILGDHYLDPQVLIDASEPNPTARLVPVD